MLELVNKIKPELEESIEYFKRELLTIRTGRANIGLVEDIEVECYNSKMSLKQLAAIHMPEPRQIVIQPWDKQILPQIEKALSSQSSLSVRLEEDAIRVIIPPFDEEERLNLVKKLNEKAEEVRVAIRGHREKAWKEIREETQEGRLREDDKFRAKDELQELVDEYNEKIEELRKKKEEEIMRV